MEGESSFLFFSSPSRERIERLLNYCPDLELDDDYHFSYDEWQGGGLNVLAIDLNPLCVKTTNKNVQLNHQQKVIRVIEGEAGDFVDEPVDLIVANIHHEVVKSFIRKGLFQEKDSTDHFRIDEKSVHRNQEAIRKRRFQTPP